MLGVYLFTEWRLASSKEQASTLLFIAQNRFNLEFPTDCWKLEMSLFRTSASKSTIQCLLVTKKVSQYFRLVLFLEPLLCLVSNSIGIFLNFMANHLVWSMAKPITLSWIQIVFTYWCGYESTFSSRWKHLNELHIILVSKALTLVLIIHGPIHLILNPQMPENIVITDKLAIDHLYYQPVSKIGLQILKFLFICTQVTKGRVLNANKCTEKMLAFGQNF